MEVTQNTVTLYSVNEVYITCRSGRSVAQLVEALRYEPEVRGFDS